MASSRNEKAQGLGLTTLVCLSVVALLICPCFTLVSGQISSSIHRIITRSSNLENKINPGEATTNLSFQKFIHKEPDSTVIAEFKPNASDLDLMLLRNKIANTIASMKDSERDQLNRGSDGSQNQCFIEVTKVERIAGRCVKASGGLPICQSDNYMAVNTDCNQA